MTTTNRNADKVKNFDPASLKWLPLKAAGGAAIGASASNAWAGMAASEPASEIAIGAASETALHTGSEIGAHVAVDAAAGEAVGFGPIGIILMCCGL